MSEVMHIYAYRHLRFKDDGRIFVTVCPDGNVIYNGRLTTLQRVTEEILGFLPVNYKEWWVVVFES